MDSDLVDVKLTKALAHPTRVHILNVLNDGPNSPSKIAKKIPNTSLESISHHIKVLRDLGCIELLTVLNQSGRDEHIYRATEKQFFSADEWQAIDVNSRTPITVSILQMISEDVNRSLLSRKFDELPDNHLSRSPIDVDQKGWAEVVEILERTLEEVLTVHERSAARSVLSSEDLIRTRVVMMQFPTASEDWKPIQGDDGSADAS